MKLPHNIGLAGGILALSVCLLWAADQGRERKYQQAVDLFESKGDVKGAIKLFEEVAKSPDRNLTARSLFYLGECYEKLGQDGARKAYERVVREFGDQADVSAKARTRLAALGEKRPETGVVARLIWSSGHGRQYGNAVSRDGRYIAYTKGGVYVHDLVTGEVRLLPGTSPASQDEHFSGALISPYGKQVAYAITIPENNGTFSRHLYVIGSDGSGRRLLVGGKGVQVPVESWSADGKQILADYWTKETGRKTAFVSLADGSLRLTQWKGEPHISPDGRYIAYVKYRDSGAGIFLEPVSGGPEVQVYESAGSNDSPRWTPDGKRLVFVSDRRGPDELWSIRVTDGKPAGAPEIPDGGGVQFRESGSDRLLDVTRDGDCYYDIGKLARDLYVADVDPETGKLIGQPKLIPTGGVNAGAAWSPDGENLLYYVRRPQGTAKVSIVIRSATTGEERVLEPKGDFNCSSGAPQWFPDGRSLFSVCWVREHDQGAYKIRQLDIHTGEQRTLLENVTFQGGNELDHPVVLAPDGRTIYYTRRDSEAHHTSILRRDLSGGPEKDLSQPFADAISFFSVSPDGTRLAFMKKSATVWALDVLPTGGGQAKELCKGDAPARANTQQNSEKPLAILWTRNPVWSKDGRRVFFAIATAAPNPADEWKFDLASVSAEGGEPQLLGVGLHAQYFLNIHPDGKQLVLADEQYADQLWVLKSLFPQTKASR